MAPTEILAQQHCETLRRLGEPAGLRIELLTGRRKGDARKTLTAEIEAGEIDIVRRHSRPVFRRREFPRSCTYRDRRTAPVRRPAAYGAGRKGSGVDMLTTTATPIRAH